MREDINNGRTNHSGEAALSAAHLPQADQKCGYARDVLAADDISNDEKRAILASWASDIFGVKIIPALRLYPGADQLHLATRSSKRSEVWTYMIGNLDRKIRQPSQSRIAPPRSIATAVRRLARWAIGKEIVAASERRAKLCWWIVEELATSRSMRRMRSIGFRTGDRTFLTRASRPSSAHAMPPLVLAPKRLNFQLQRLVSDEL